MFTGCYYSSESLPAIRALYSRRLRAQTCETGVRAIPMASLCLGTRTYQTNGLRHRQIRPADGSRIPWASLGPVQFPCATA
ncbi:hypothetical protein RRG08_054987 [Elysia crispata]|uniref:Uncharacterized protein n=1 Tax=Elysia crispata TaxID=231223 RepID=A0AAE1A889_9GAST|nr:hypothetical protein RRG08_054987 [Elysia crispata]